MLGHEAEPSNQNTEEETGRRILEIDENLHSRHLALYGRETMERIMNSNVLISGMQGLGVEIAKNLILAGVKSVWLHDEGRVELWDLSGSFIFNFDDVGINRALVSAEKLQELNHSVDVHSLTSELILDNLSEFQAVVLTSAKLETAKEIDDYCHNHQPPIPFIKSEVRGLFGQIFCDFGPEFEFIDYDAVHTKTGIIEYVTSGNPTVVTCVEDDPLPFKNEDLVVFSEVQGMEELNDGRPRKVLNSKPHSFILNEDSSNYGKYLKGGIATQVHPPKPLNFKTLRTALEDPCNLFLKSCANRNPALLHLAFQTLDKFLCDLERFPEPGCENDATKFQSMLAEMNSDHLRLTEAEENLLRLFAFGARAVLNPMASIFGGLVAQEVIKASTGKWHPIHQFFYFHSIESLPKEPAETEYCQPMSGRYDAQISVFGLPLQRKMEDAKVFIVGCGSLGCELLKNFAVMGVACGTGTLTFADGDIIESANIPNHLLFRSENIGQLKSLAAAPVAQLINPYLRVQPVPYPASPWSETAFTPKFWESLTVVLNAVDDLRSKVYVDQKCGEFGKTHIYSSTAGAKCDTQVVLPKITTFIVARGLHSEEQQEEEPSDSTLLSFPYKISHCLTWAQSSFDDFFQVAPEVVEGYLHNPSYYANLIREASHPTTANGSSNITPSEAKDGVNIILHCIENRCKNFQDCVSIGRFLFHDYFTERINKLIQEHPEHSLADDGTPFWSAPKRFPVPLEFSSDDIAHFDFVIAASIAIAEMYEIEVPDWAASCSEMAAAMNSYTIPDSEPNEDDTAVADRIMARIEELAKDLPEDFGMSSLRLAQDNEASYFYDLITGLTNLRARCYGIPEIDKLKVKTIVKNIKPAVATSAAIAAGMVCLELYKVFDGTHTPVDFRNSLVDLARPRFSFDCPRFTD